MSFNLGGHYVSLHTTELLMLFDVNQENVNQMRTTIGFFPDMNEHQFRLLTMNEVLGKKRTKNISHPALRYIQRVLSHTLFARGETASVFNDGDMTYIASMLRRNNEEMMYMPHITYNLAKHIKNIANNLAPGGIVRIGGIITKIARVLNIPTGDDVVPGYTLVDLDGLVRARLIRYDDIQAAWINLGVDNVLHRLPLRTRLDPMNYPTWKIVDPPLEEPQAPPPPAPGIQGIPQQVHPDAAPQGGPTMQQMWDFMQTMHTSLTDNMNNLRLNMNSRFDTLERRMDEVETESAAAHHYARRGCTYNNPDFEDDPPTPPYQRRVARAHEAVLAREAAQAARAAAQAAQEAGASGAQRGVEEENDDEEEDDEEEDDDMDHDA